MTTLDYDVIVVGAGIEGSATAYSLAKSNYRTLLIDQFALPHSRGSSHGHTRITRRAYIQRHYSTMMVAAHNMWRRLEAEQLTQIFCQNGLLELAPQPAVDVDLTISALEGTNSTYERIDGENINRKYPQMHFEDYRSVYDPEGGILLADRALKAYWNQFKKLGGIIHDAEPVISITPGEPVTITTSKTQYRSRSVVLCLGPWTSKIIKPLGLHLPLRTSRIDVFYWRVRSGDYSADKMPCLRGTIDDMHIYLIPCCEYPGHVKFCHHDGVAADPDNRDTYTEAGSREAQHIQDGLQQIVEDHFPGLEPVPSLRESCMYTSTPDNSFILDRHPQWKNIVIGAGFSGHGFKIAPVVGKILAELATNRPPSFDVTPFKIDRCFQTSSKL